MDTIELLSRCVLFTLFAYFCTKFQVAEVSSLLAEIETSLDICLEKMKLYTGKPAAQHFPFYHRLAVTLCSPSSTCGTKLDAIQTKLIQTYCTYTHNNIVAV